MTFALKSLRRAWKIKQNLLGTILALLKSAAYLACTHFSPRLLIPPRAAVVGCGRPCAPQIQYRTVFSVAKLNSCNIMNHCCQTGLVPACDTALRRRKSPDRESFYYGVSAAYRLQFNHQLKPNPNAILRPAISRQIRPQHQLYTALGDRSL